MIWNEVSTEDELRSIGTFIEIKALINSDLDGICLLKARSWATLFKKITKLQEIFSQNNDHEKDSMHLPELDFFKSITHSTYTA